jgi:phage terminase large subunit
MSRINIPTARAFVELTNPARYLGAYSGRGAGKSHFFAEMLVERCLLQRGTLGVCIREVQRTLAQSSKRLIETKIADLGVGSEFRVPLGNVVAIS